MATAGTPHKPSAAELVVKKLAELEKKVDVTGAAVAGLQKAQSRATRTSGSTAVSPREAFGVPQGAPNVMSGEHGERPYSFLKAVAYATGAIPADMAKEEVEINKRLKSFYTRNGFSSGAGSASFMIPFSSMLIPQIDQESETLVRDIRQKSVRGAANMDWDEMNHINKSVGGYYTKTLQNLQTKTMTVTGETTGGVLVGFPTLGELVDLQRNMEVFPNCGATETTLPPNGRIQYPKLTGGSTAYFLGEGATGTSSTPTTGYLDLVAKKLFVITYINNELLKFNTISAEAMLRLDMARVGALRADLSMLEGQGGTEVTGLINYPTQTAPWTAGNDNLITYTVTGVGTIFAPADAAAMVEALPDPVQDPTAWIMRKSEWAKIINRRSDVLTTGDGLGQFVFWTARGHAAERPPYELYNVPVVRSNQVSKTRGGGSATYVIVGFFPDWIIARSGVMEFVASNVSDVGMLNDQTLLRGIQYLDAGARHAASFVFADAVVIG